MHMPEIPDFRVRAIGTTRDDRVRVMDHLSEGERAALVHGEIQALRNRRYLRWN